MKRLTLIAAACLYGSLAWAQQINSFTVSTSMPGARFRVDGTEYFGAASFLWPQGSKHILQFDVTDDGFQYAGVGNIRYSLGGWTTPNGALSPSGALAQTITADPAVTSYIADVAVQYRIFLVMAEGVPADANPACGAPGDGSVLQMGQGVVYVGGTCYQRNATLWLSPGPVSVNAFPYPGFVFEGWVFDNSPVAFLGTVNIVGPRTLHARFAAGKRVKFITDPPGLQVLVDRTPSPTSGVEPCAGSSILPPGAPRSIAPLCPGEFDWALSSKHVIGAPSPQTDKYGQLWVFDSFDNGSGQNALYTVNSLMPPEMLTAKFVRGARVSFVTNPTGLKLNVDGRDNWPSYNFVGAVGVKYQVSAPAEQVDLRGRRYVFRGWSNGGDASQEVVVSEEAAAKGLRLIADYELLSQVILQSSPGGTTIEVDGSTCSTPCVLDRPDGTEVTLAAPAQRQLSEVHRLEFASWSDGGARERTVKVSGQESRTVTATYATAYRLQAVSDPAGGSRFLVDPPSPDSYYKDGVYVTITAQPEPGYRFRRWGGDLEGTFRTSGFVISAPCSAVALLDRVPFIPPAGVSNAAGPTPEDGVAPGSVISIYGANLAEGLEIGPENPLAQSVGGVTVRVGDRILPLMFVSPEQINAVLPSSLGEGTYPVTVSRIGQPDVKGEVTVVRNAPGLFGRMVDSTFFAVATHADGSAITLESPAKRGEVVSLYGTGFGPYRQTVPDGFALPETPEFQLADPVELLAGDAVVPLVGAKGAPNLVGIVLAQFRIAEELPAASSIELRVSVNEHESNRVVLPIE